MLSHSDLRGLHYQLYLILILQYYIQMTLIRDSDKLEVKQIDQNTKGLFSKSDFKPWSSVLQVNPICVSVAAQLRNKFCNFCLLQKQTMKCSHCKVLYYCSKQCQTEDWKLHKSLCKVLYKIVKQKSIQPNSISVQISLNLRLWVCRNKSKQIEEQIKQMCSLLQYQPPEKLHKFQQIAVVLLQNLGIQKNQSNMSKMVAQQSIVSLNCFTIQDYLCNYEFIGAGIYWPANFINHHCHPNCTQIFDGSILKIVANRPIAKGQQITISYMPRLQTLQKKQQICRQGYLFECFCEQCQVNKMFNYDLLYLKCPSCHNSTIRNRRKHKAITEQHQSQQITQKQYCNNRAECEKCGSQVDKTQINELISKRNKLIESISMEEVDYEKTKKNLIELRKLISSNDPVFEKCIHRVYLLALQAASQDEAMYKQSYILLKQMVELMPTWYRLSQEEEIPYVYIWRIAQLGKLAYNLQKYKKACEFTQKAYSIIEKLKFANIFVQVKELKERHQQMKIGLSLNKAEIFRKGAH